MQSCVKGAHVRSQVYILSRRYATEGGMLESAIMGGLRGVDAHLAQNQRAARLRLFSPGGHLAKELAHNATSARLVHIFALHFASFVVASIMTRVILASASRSHCSLLFSPKYAYACCLYM